MNELQPNTSQPVVLGVCVIPHHAAIRLFAALDTRNSKRQRRIPAGTHERYVHSMLCVCDGCHQPCLFFGSERQLGLGFLNLAD